MYFRVIIPLLTAFWWRIKCPKIISLNVAAPFLSLSLSFQSSLSKNKKHFLGLLSQGLGKTQKGIWDGNAEEEPQISFIFWTVNSIYGKHLLHFCFTCFPYWFIYTALLSQQHLVHRFVISAFPPPLARAPEPTPQLPPRGGGSPGASLSPRWSPLWLMFTNTHTSFPNWSKWIKHSSA